MPKSRNNNKNHKKRLKAYKDKSIQRQNQLKKSYMEMLQSKKSEELNQRLTEHQENEMSDVVDASDIGLDLDMDLDIDEEKK